MAMALIGLNGIFFIYTALHSLIAPVKFARMLNLEPVGRSGNIEIRAQYGGFFLAAGLSQFAALSRYLTLYSALIISLVIFGGLVFGRILALMFRNDGTPLTAVLKTLYVIDAVGFMGSIVALQTIAH